MRGRFGLAVAAIVLIAGGCGGGDDGAPLAAQATSSTSSTVAETTTEVPTTVAPTTVAPAVATTARPAAAVATTRRPTAPAPAPPPPGPSATTNPCPYLGSHPHIEASAPPYPPSNGAGGAQVTITGTCFGPNNTDSPGGEGNWSPVEWIVDGAHYGNAGDLEVPPSGSFTFALGLPTDNCGHVYTVQAREGASQAGVPNHVFSNTLNVKPC